MPRCDLPRVVALGDSVTVGVGDRVHRGARKGWAAHLAAVLGASGFHNLSRTGARARDIVSEQLEPALALRPCIATVLVGGNDVLRADLDPARVGQDVREACLALTASGAVVVVVLLHDPQRALPRAAGSFGRVISARAALVSAAERQLVAGLPGVLVVDPAGDPGTYARPNWHVDRMHPSARGHRRLAVLAASALAPAGFPPRFPLPPVPASAPGPMETSAWLVRNGVPWFAKRSVDLIPELVGMVWAERRGLPEDPWAGRTSCSPVDLRQGDPTGAPSPPRGRLVKAPQ